MQCIAQQKPERRKAVGGALLSMALTSFLTGVTEPIEFSFMFLAPVLYAIHAVLTGISMVIMDMLGVKMGFGFSAGLFDWLINLNKATRPWLLWPVGFVYFALYYSLFRLAIRVFDLKTMGREDDVETLVPLATAQSSRGGAFVAALGGAENLVTVDACTTRLRLGVQDGAKVDEARLKALGSRGVVRPSAKALQVVLGPQADQIAGEIRAALREQSCDRPPRVVPSWRSELRMTLAALGGAGNIQTVAANASRLQISLAVPDAVDEARLHDLGARGIAKLGSKLHLLVGPEAPAIAEKMRTLPQSCTELMTYRSR